VGSGRAEEWLAATSTPKLQQRFSSLGVRVTQADAFDPSVAIDESQVAGRSAYAPGLARRSRCRLFEFVLLPCMLE